MRSCGLKSFGEQPHQSTMCLYWHLQPSLRFQLVTRRLLSTRVSHMWLFPSTVWKNDWDGKNKRKCETSAAPWPQVTINCERLSKIKRARSFFCGIKRQLTHHSFSSDIKAHSYINSSEPYFSSGTSAANCAWELKVLHYLRRCAPLTWQGRTSLTQTGISNCLSQLWEARRPPKAYLPRQGAGRTNRTASALTPGRPGKWWRTPRSGGWEQTSLSHLTPPGLLECCAHRDATCGCHTRGRDGRGLAS